MPTSLGLLILHMEFKVNDCGFMFVSGNKYKNHTFMSGIKGIWLHIQNWSFFQRANPAYLKKNIQI